MWHELKKQQGGSSLSGCLKFDMIVYVIVAIKLLLMGKYYKHWKPHSQSNYNIAPVGFELLITMNCLLGLCLGYDGVFVKPED